MSYGYSNKFWQMIFNRFCLISFILHIGILLFFVNSKNIATNESALFVQLLNVENKKFQSKSIVSKDKYKKVIKRFVNKGKVKKYSIMKSRSLPLFRNKEYNASFVQARFEPNYPIKARVKRYQGLVTLDVMINGKGCPEKVTIKKSTGYRILDNSAINAIQKWKFYCNYVRMTIPVLFRLS